MCCSHYVCLCACAFSLRCVYLFVERIRLLWIDPHYLFAAWKHLIALWRNNASPIECHVGMRKHTLNCRTAYTRNSNSTNNNKKESRNLFVVVVICLFFSLDFFFLPDLYADLHIAFGCHRVAVAAAATTSNNCKTTIKQINRLPEVEIFRLHASDCFLVGFRIWSFHVFDL